MPSPYAWHRSAPGAVQHGFLRGMSDGLWRVLVPPIHGGPHALLTQCARVCVCIGAVFGATQAYTHCGWQGYAHWLGTTSASSVRDTNKNSTPPLPFHEAVAVVHALGLQNREEWRAWCQSEARASNMPLWPNSAYKKSGWRGWGHGRPDGREKLGCVPAGPCAIEPRRGGGRRRRGRQGTACAGRPRRRRRRLWVGPEEGRRRSQPLATPMARQLARQAGAGEEEPCA